MGPHENLSSDDMLTFCNIILFWLSFPRIIGQNLLKEYTSSLMERLLPLNQVYS